MRRVAVLLVVAGLSGVLGLVTGVAALVYANQVRRDVATEIDIANANANSNDVSIPASPGAPGEPGTSGEPGDDGPAPTEVQILQAVATFCEADDHCQPPGPTATQTLEAVTAYCSTGACGRLGGEVAETGPPGAPGAPGRPPTVAEIQAAVELYFVENPLRPGPIGPVGPVGPIGPVGPPGGTPTVLTCTGPISIGGLLDATCTVIASTRAAGGG